VSQNQEKISKVTLGSCSSCRHPALWEAVLPRLTELEGLPGGHWSWKLQIIHKFPGQQKLLLYLFSPDIKFFVSLALSGVSSAKFFGHDIARGEA
jgi:hypothetical protein